MAKKKITAAATAAATVAPNTITGILYDEFNVPLPGKQIQLFRKSLRTEQLLGSATTDGKGFYSINYDPGTGTAPTDIFIRVQGMSSTTGTQSTVHHNIPTSFELNFKIGNEPIQPVNEFDRLLQKIDPIVQAQQLAIKDLQENSQFRDISFLSGETGEDAKKISYMPTAFQLSEQTGIQPAIFYALSRLNFPTALNDLLLVKKDALLKGMQTAIQKNILSPQWTTHLPTVIQQFDQRFANLVINSTENKFKSFKNLFTTTGLSTDLQVNFVTTYLANETNLDQFWTQLATKPGFTDGTAIPKIKTILELHHFTNYQPALTSLLYQEGVQNTAFAKLRGFAALTQNDWKNRITGLVNAGTLVAFPTGIEGATPAEKADQYAAYLAKTMKRLYPMNVFAERMKQDSTDAFNLSRADLQTFFSKNPAYELDSNNIGALLAQADYTGVQTQNQAKLKTELEHINRLYKLTNDYAPVATLRKANITSSSGIVLRYGQQIFKEQFAAALGSAENAAEVYRKALSVHKKAMAIAVNYKATHELPIYTINGVPDPTAQNTLRASLEEMFGNATLCDCAECSSVHSPAAYLADLLHFLKGQSGDQNPPFTVLTNRRPDLADLHLTCANSNTPLPYIDIVNELLERIVAEQPITAFQTTDTAEVLAAYPQHTLEAAYTRLNSSRAAYQLPMSLPLETARILLEKLGISRQALLETFLPEGLALLPGEPIMMQSATTRYNDKEVAKEILHLSETELDVLNGTSTITGKTGNAALTSILNETGLTYVELLEVLQSYFINPQSGANRTWNIVAVAGAPPATCDLSQLTIPGMNAAGIIKIIRFRRLQQKTGWSTIDLDRVLTAMNITSFDRARTGVDAKAGFNLDILIPLSQIIYLQKRSGLPVQKILALLYPIDINGYVDHATEEPTAIPSLYDQLFRDKTIFNPLNASFTEKAVGLSGTLTAHTATLLKAFRITQEDLTLLMSGIVTLLPPVTDTLSLPNLSLLYRRTLLAQVLGLSVTELLHLVRHIGIAPLENNFAAILQYIDHLSLLRSEKIVIKDLQYLLTSHIRTTAQAAPVETIAGTLERVRESLKKIAQEAGSIDLSSNDKAKASVIDLFSTALQVNHATAKIIVTKTVKFTGPPVKSLMEILLADSFFNSASPLFTITAAKKAIPATEFDRFFKAYWFAEKLAFLINKYQLTAEETDFLTEKAVPLNIDKLLPLQLTDQDTNGNDIPYTALQRFCRLMQIRKLLPGKDTKWWEPINILLLNNASLKSNFVDAFSTASGIDTASLEVLLGNKSQANAKGLLNAVFPSEYLMKDILLRVLACCKMAAGMGCSVKEIGTAMIITSAPSTLNVNDELLLQTIEPVLKARSSETAWLSMIKPVSNKLRMRKRDALTAFILSDPAMLTFRQDNNITGTNSLYEHLLIDVEMDACMYTSRIKQAISTVQLFVNRCLMNLEPDATLSEDFEQQWKSWRKQYRVWEANRKIFLYPENWVEPELRDDKTPLFKEVEAKLLQNEVTTEAVEDAMREYLVKLDKVANLEIVGHFRHTETGRTIIHVFGRTRNQPHQYYYRKQINNAWTAWEKIDLDIEDSYLLPVVWKNRLFLFWTTFTDKPWENPNGTTIPAPGGNIPPATKIREVKLAWSEYRNGKWGGKHVSVESSFFNESTAKKDSVFLTSKFVNGKLEIWIMGLKYFSPNIFHSGGWYYMDLGYYTMNRINDIPRFILIVPLTDLFLTSIGIIGGTETKKMTLQKISLNNLSIYETGYGSKGFYYSPPDWMLPTVELFRKLNTGQLLPDHHDIFNRERDTVTTFFYENGKNNLYAQSLLVEIPPVNSTTFHNLNGTALQRNPINLPDITPEPAQPAQLVDPGPVQNPEPPAGPVTNAPQIMVKKYAFETFYHPYVTDLMQALNAEGVNGIFTEGMKDRIPQEIFTTTQFDPTAHVKTPYPVEKIDFDFSGTYSAYNWELFFHLPLLIATRLSRNQRFEEALQWFHYIFDPTKPPAAANEGPERFWITQPFKQAIKEGIKSIEELLNDPANQENLHKQLEYWEQYPFRPHAVARLRISAYMRTTVMKYIDNLIAWGDQLFARDTIESINEATLLYILAANILGKKPERVPARAIPVASSFNDIANQLDDFSNSNVKVQLFIPPSGPNTDTPTDNNILMPLFGIPGNSSLLKYWDTVADRLFKIRHCMNLQGVVRQLPLFEPPVDPALLVKATAMGLDLNSIMNDINAPLPHYRFSIILQKANELCSDIKSLGSALLTTLEKKDAEQLALLRSGHELTLLKAIRDIKTGQRDEAKETLDGLRNSREVIQNRKEYYKSRQPISYYERSHIDSLTSGIDELNKQQTSDAIANSIYALPDAKFGSPTTAGTTYGGTNLGNAARAFSAWFASNAGILNLEGSKAATLGGYERRSDDWFFQAGSAHLELKQVDRLIAAAEIRLAIAEKDLQNHDLQQENAREVDEYMRSKFTNVELYDYMTGQLSAVYFQSYQLAYQLSRKAEKCLHYELGIENTSFIQFGYWDSLKKGLLSGEKLQYDLRRLENAYVEQNTRELEITKHISTALIHPVALIQLKETGKCSIQLPEEIFDLDFPGHYFRRIKSVSISIPCIAGPYAGVHATLRLTSNEYRVDKLATNAATYKKTQAEIASPGSGRFRQSGTPVAAIATSNAQNDSGVFELNFRDERYLPFEGAGAISTWSLELMEDASLRQFDYETISDVILHLKYTARDGGAPFKVAATENVKQVINQSVGNGMPLAVLFDVEHEFAGEWHQFVNSTQAGDPVLVLPISKNRLPFFTADRNVTIQSITFAARKKKSITENSIPFTFNNESQERALTVGGIEPLLSCAINHTLVIPDPGVSLPSVMMKKDGIAKIEALYVVITYTLS